jgi:hypothetical protein
MQFSIANETTMDPATSKRIKTYLAIALWALLVASMITFWIVECVLILKGHKNATDSVERVVHVKTLLDTMMMDQIGNASFDSLVVLKGQKNHTEKLKQVEGVKSMLDDMMADFPKT